MTESETADLVRRFAASRDNMCFACGPGNPVGLHLYFEQADGGVRCVFAPQDVHHGWQHSVHGGILATALDEAMAYCLFFAGVQGVTARMEIRYRETVRDGELLLVQARMTRDSRKIADVEGSVSREGTIVAEATGRFYKVGDLSTLAEAFSAPNAVPEP